MGLIKNIFGAIVGVIKAIFGIFGLGKKSEYFLEADNRESRSKPQAQPQADAKEEKPAAPAAKESAPAPAATTRTEAPAADPAQAAPAPAPKPVPMAPKPEPVGNFATDYLMAPSANMGRRRPGPSLSPFKDLAKDMKLPSGAQ